MHYNTLYYVREQFEKNAMQACKLLKDHKKKEVMTLTE